MPTRLKSALFAVLVLLGFAPAAHAIQVTSPSLCFDVVVPPASGACPAADRPLVVGMTRRLALDILNDEGAPTNLQNPAPAAPFFLCTAATGACVAPSFPIAIANGGTATFFVEYRPTAAGTHSLTLNLNASASFASADTRGSAHLLDLVMVFDNSGSMSWKPDGTETMDAFQSRLRFAKDAANELVTLLNGVPGIATGTRAGVCIFNYAPAAPSDTAACPQTLAPFASGPLTTAINGVPIIWDGTQMGRGLQAALDRLSGGGTCPAGHRCVILMLSNGAHNQGIAPEGLLVSKQATLFAIGYGTMRDVDPARLATLVTQSGNSPGAGARHFDPVGCPASVPVERCLTTTKQLDGFFLSVLQSLGLLQAAADPRVTIAPGQTQTHDVQVVDLDRAAQFMVSWETPPSGLLRFDLLDAEGKVVDPLVARQDPDVDFEVGSSFMVYRVREGYLRRPGKLGTWKIRVSYGGSIPDLRRAAVVIGPFTYNYAAFMASALELLVQFDRTEYSTGDPVLLTASVTASGVRLRGAAIDGITAPLDRPEQGIGTWHAEHGALPQWIAAIPAVRSGEPLSAAQRKGLAATLVGGVALPQRAPAPELVFHDDGSDGDAQAGDGVYSARFTDTGKPDTYTFHLTAKGKTPGGWAFTREALVQQFITVNVVPDPATSPLTFQTVKVIGPVTQVRVQVVPKDRFGNFLGPDQGRLLEFVTTSGTWLGPVEDDLRGGYSRILEYRPASQSPDVKVTVQGKDFPTQDVKQASRPRFELGLFAGRFFFDKRIPIDDGPVFGLRAGLPLTTSLSLEAEVAVTPTDDAVGQGGKVFQAAASLRWDLGGLSFWSLTPFVTGGVGYLDFSGFSTTDSSGFVHFGAGVQARVSPRTRFRLDARDIFAFDTFGHRTDNLQVTVGVAVGF
jgi:hypothetical protein